MRLTIWQEIQCLAGGIAQGIWRTLEKQEDLVTDLMGEGIPVPKGDRRQIHTQERHPVMKLEADDQQQRRQKRRNDPARSMIRDQQHHEEDDECRNGHRAASHAQAHPPRSQQARDDPREERRIVSDEIGFFIDRGIDRSAAI